MSAKKSAKTPVPVTGSIPNQFCSGTSFQTIGAALLIASKKAFLASAIPGGNMRNPFIGVDFALNSTEILLKNLILAFTVAIFGLIQPAAHAQDLTIQSIFGTAALTGRAPDTIQWSPDAKKVSYFLHQEQGDKT